MNVKVNVTSLNGGARLWGVGGVLCSALLEREGEREGEREREREGERERERERERGREGERKLIYMYMYSLPHSSRYHRWQYTGQVGPSPTGISTVCH